MSSSMNALNSLSMLRMSGLASGMDTESMVTSLMNAEKMKYAQLEKQKIKMDWKKAANLEVNNLLRDFREKFFSAANPSSNILSSSRLLAYKVTMNSTSSSVSVTAGSDALEGRHTVNSITSLASGASAASGASVKTADISLNTELSALPLATALDFSGGDISFSINGKAFSFKSTDTLRKVITTVSNDADANVTMGYSNLTGKFTIASKNTGAASSLSIANGAGNAFGAGSAFGIAEGTFANGTDATLEIDGVTVTRGTNNFTIDGIAYALKETTASSVSFDVSRDIDGAVQKIKDFVDAYNKLIETLDGKISETVNRDYQPLTEEEKAELSDAQVEKWESLAKSGLLRGDSYISGLLQDLRGSFFSKVAGAGASASSIGLSTIGYLSKGAIQVDETKLRAALTNNPDQVIQVFTDTSASTSAAVKYSESGLASRMQTSINEYLNDYLGYRMESFNDQYDHLEDRMVRMQDILEMKETRYWKQFTAMETALNNMNAQSAWLSQQFASKS